MRVVRFDAGGAVKGGRELAGPGAPIWVDCAPTPESLAFLAQRFHFHPLALEDCAHEGQRAKVEQFQDHLFVVIHRIVPAPDETDLAAYELHAFIAPGVLVTVHSVPFGEIDRVLERSLAEPDLVARGVDFLLYLVHDAVTDVHFSLVDALTSDVEDIADEALGEEPDRDLAQRIAEARRKHLVLRRRLAPQREVFASLARPGQALVREATAVYFRDVVDHLVRLTEEVDTGRELLASSMEGYLSRTNNRLTAVTTRLTLAATIFLPLNFVVGFFGMNLDILPPPVAIPLVLAITVAVPLSLWLFFRRRRWL